MCCCIDYWQISRYPPPCSLYEKKLKEFNEKFGYVPIDLSSIEHQEFLAKISEIDIPASNDRDRKAVINGYAHSLLKKMMIFYLS